MEINKKKKALSAVFGIMVILGVCGYLIFIDVLPYAVFLIALLGCYPWGKYLWSVISSERRNTVRILKATLPKFGFIVEESSWDDDHSVVSILGKYQEEKFLVTASPGAAYIKVYDLPWLDVKSTDPSMPHMMEAVNDTNANIGNCRVIVSNPDSNGTRNVYTCSVTILPSYKPDEYLESLMCDMLNCKRTLAESIKQERPWMRQKRNPIGFSSAYKGMDKASDDTQESEVKTQ